MKIKTLYATIKKESKKFPYGKECILIGLVVGLALPLVLLPFIHTFLWPLTHVGILIILAYGVIVKLQLQKDFGDVPRYMRKIAKEYPFDPETQEAVVRCSICTGEKVAGFKDKETGHFTEVLIIIQEKDLEHFKKAYYLEDIRKEY